MRRSTIKGRILRTSLSGVGIILLLIGFAAYSLISSWMNSQFDASLLSKAQGLITLFEEVEGGFEFQFADEFMPEFERTDNPEYFQFWLSDESVFEKSNSLTTFDLPRISSSANMILFQNLQLVDNRHGRMVQITFVPQLDQALRTETRTASDELVVLVVARERASLNTRITIVRLIILISIPVIMLLIYFALRYSIDGGLKPLEELKRQITGLDSSELSGRVNINIPVMDLEGLVTSTNDALQRIESSFKRERRFTDDAAHELRTPISELLNMAEVAKKWPDQVSHSEFYDDVLGAGKKLQLIVNSLLALARCKNGQIEVSLTDVDLSDQLFQAWSMHSDKARGKNIKIELDISNKVWVFSSPVELELILSNLISNAVEYSARDSVVIVSVERGVDTLDLAISNRTDDLNPNDVNHMFDSLWRKDSARSSDEHIGIGLTLVKAYAEVLQINIDASLDKSIFTIKLSGFRLTK